MIVSRLALWSLVCAFSTRARAMDLLFQPLLRSGWTVAMLGDRYLAELLLGKSTYGIPFGPIGLLAYHFRSAGNFPVIWRSDCGKTQRDRTRNPQSVRVYGFARTR